MWESVKLGVKGAEHFIRKVFAFGRKETFIFFGSFLSSISRSFGQRRVLNICGDFAMHFGDNFFVSFLSTLYDWIITFKAINLNLFYL